MSTGRNRPHDRGSDLKVPAEEIFGIINTFFREGVSLSEEVISYAESSLGCGIDGIKDFLSDCDGYCGGLIPLIFFPSYDLKKAVEPAIPLRGLNENEIYFITGRLFNDNRSLSLLINGLTAAVISADKTVFNSFISHLRLNAGLIIYGSESELNCISTELRIKMRNSRFSVTPDRREFLKKCFIAGTWGSDPVMSDEKLLKAYDLINRIFSADISDRGPVELIAERISIIEDIFEQQREFNLISKRFSMDFLMLTRTSIPVYSIDDLIEERHLLSALLSGFSGTIIQNNPPENNQPVTLYDLLGGK